MLIELINRTGVLMNNLFNILFILGISLIPSIIMLGIILYSDRKSKEPISLILLCTISGFFTITLSLFIQNYILNTLNLVHTEQLISIQSGLRIFVLSSIEEYCKLFILYFFFSRLKSFDDIYDGFVYSAIIALSFAAIETVMYVFKEVTMIDQSALALTRTFTAIPLHLVCGIVMGYYIALEKFSKKKKYKILELIKSITLPIIIHSIYNIILTFVPVYTTNTTIIQIFIISYIVSIYIIGILYIKKNKKLNELFIKNRKYPDKYKFLMHKPEFIKKLKKRKSKSQ